MKCPEEGPHGCEPIRIMLGSAHHSGSVAMKLIKTLRLAAAVLTLALGTSAALAQAPRTIKIVVPFPAGGSADTLARIFADQIGKAGGSSMVVENRPGAG